MLCDPILRECYLHCMCLILSSVKIADDGQLTETFFQDKVK